MHKCMCYIYIYIYICMCICIIIIILNMFVLNLIITAAHALPSRAARRKICRAQVHWPTKGNAL